MLARFMNSFNTKGSENQTGSAFACAAFFAALLLLIDTAFAVSIFVSASLAGVLLGIIVSILVCLIILCVLLLVRQTQKRPDLSAA